MKLITIREGKRKQQLTVTERGESIRLLSIRTNKGVGTWDVVWTNEDESVVILMGKLPLDRNTLDGQYPFAVDNRTDVALVDSVDMVPRALKHLGIGIDKVLVQILDSEVLARFCWAS